MTVRAAALSLAVAFALTGCGGKDTPKGGTTGTNLGTGANGGTSASTGSGASSGSSGTAASGSGTAGSTSGSTGASGSGGTGGSGGTTSSPGADQLKQVPGAQLMAGGSQRAEVRQVAGSQPTMSSTHFKAKLGVVPTTAP